MNGYCSVSELQRKYELDAKEAEEEAAKYKREMLNKMQLELEKRKAEQKIREEERKNKILAQLK